MKTCFNCKNAKCYKGSDDTRDCPGEPPMAECKFGETDGKGNVRDEKVFDIGEANEWNEELMPAKCGHYEPMVYEKCGHCGYPMNSPVYLHTVFAYDSFSGEPVAVCFDACRVAYNAESDRKFKEQEKNEREAMEYVRPVKVWLECSKKLVDEAMVGYFDLEENLQGEDVLTFSCPECKCEHTSRRFG